MRLLEAKVAVLREAQVAAPLVVLVAALAEVQVAAPFEAPVARPAQGQASLVPAPAFVSAWG